MIAPRSALLPPIAALLAALVACDGQDPSATDEPSTLVGDPLLEQGRNLLRQGDYARAADQFRGLVAERPDVPSVYAGLAIAALKLGDISEAVRACSTGLTVDSTAIELHNTLAAAYAGDGRYALAIQALDRALRQHPDFAFGHANRGGLHFKLGQYQQAEPHLVMARQLDPDNPIARRRLGELFLKTGRPDSALTEISAALITHPTSETLYYLYGQALQGVDLQAEALQAYQRARSLDPGFAEAHYLTATLSRRLGRIALADSALQAYKKLQDIGQLDQQFNKRFKALRASILDSPEDPLHHFQLGRFFSRQGFDRAALHRFRRVLELNPNDLRAHNQIGRILLRNKNAAAALQHFEQCLALNHTFAPALINAGNACMLLRQYPRATTHYRTAVELRPELTLVWHHLAKGYLAMNEKGSAAKALRQGLAQAKPDDKLRRAMQELLIRIK